MELPADKFAAVLRTLFAVPAEPTLPSSQFVRMIAGKGGIRLTLSGILFGDGNVKANAASKNEEWTFYADRHALNAFAQSSQNAVTLNIKNSHLLAECGSQTMKLSPPKEVVSGYGIWPVNETVDLGLSVDDLAMLGPYCSKGAGGEQFAAIQFVKGFGAFATDSVVLSVIRNTNSPEATVPANLCPHIVRSGSAQVCVSTQNRGVGVVLADGRLHQPLHSSVSACPVSKFVSVAKEAEAKPAAFTCPVSDLFAALDALVAYPSMGANLTGEVSSTEKELRIRVTFPSGSVEKRVTVKKTSDIAATWPLNRVRPWLNYIQKRDETATVTCRRTDAATELDCGIDKNTYVLVFADL